MEEHPTNNDFDKDFFQDTVSTIIESKRIEISMDSLARQIDDYMSSVYGEKNSHEIIDTYAEALLNGTINKNTIKKLTADIILSKNLSTKEENSIELVLIYTALAKYFLNKNLESKSWTALSEAKYFLAYLFGLIDPTKYKIVERAQKGGRKKAQNALDLEKLVITLLIEKRPKRGWQFSYDAATEILSELSKRAHENNIPIPIDIKDLVHKIIIMIDENKDVSKAFKGSQEG